MTNFLLALQFLTVIPVKTRSINAKKNAQAMIFFPLVGLILALILSVVNKLLLMMSFPSLSIVMILIVLLVFLTGGLHLDGLADTADAFLSRKDKDGMLKIMRDSHIGVMGVLSTITIILLKVALIFSISHPLRYISLVLMCVLSRWSLVLAMFLFPYAREEGKAKIFIQNINFKIFSLATIITLICAIAVWQLKGLLISLVAVVSTYIIGRFINKKIDGITGDILGAINEIMEVVVLFSICIFERIHL